MKDWQVEPGTVEHLAAPRFTAKWDSSIDPPIRSELWIEPTDDEGGNLFLYSFAWLDPRPDTDAHESLMRETGSVIDAWIAERL